MRYLLLTALLVVLVPAAALAQMGPEMGMMGMGMGMAASPIDVKPIWSPDGKWIAFTRTTSQQGATGGAKAGIVAADKGTVAKPNLINNLAPLAWSPDSSGVVCGYQSAGQGQASPYAGFWLVNRADPKNITLIIQAKNPVGASYSPDKSKLLMIDERAKDMHELLVQDKGGAAKVFYSTRGGEKFLQAGWTDGSDAVWLLVDVPKDGAMAPGEKLPDKALQATGGMMGGMGMEMGMGMGPGMGMEMGMGMGMGMGAAAQSKKTLYRIGLATGAKTKVAEDVEAAGWSPTQPIIAMRKKVQKQAPAGAMGMGMGPEMGAMGPEMGMGMGMGMMGPQMVAEEYMAVRPATGGDDAEQRVNDPTAPIMVPVWSPDGKMLGGANQKEARVFAISPPAGAMIEVAQSFDGDLKDTDTIAWSPDGTKIVYPGAIDIKEGEDKYAIRGLVVQAINGPQMVQLTENKTKVQAMGMMGMGMMGPGMMP